MKPLVSSLLIGYLVFNVQVTLAQVEEPSAPPLNSDHRIKLDTLEETPASDRTRCHFDSPDNDWIDHLRSSTHSKLCRSVKRIDSLFGDDKEFNDQNFRAKLSIGFRQDTSDGFDPRLRVRIKTRLPNASERLNGFIGRVEEDSYISNTEVNQDRVNTVGLRSTGDDDAEWLVGLGYRNPNSRANGFDYSIGAKLSSGLNLYTKVAHRQLFTPNELNYWRTTQTVFWRRDDGFGVSSNLDYTRLLGRRDIIEWGTRLKYTEESRRWEWVSGLSWHHSFSKKRGVSSRIYFRGDEKNQVVNPEYGLTFAYVRPFLRPWLFIETGIDFRWEKDIIVDSYRSEVRLGIQFEMLLGDYYSEEKNGRR